ncbi:hypothetical protein [Daejeonella sp.]|jgi:hypothetical protein|uniref:hypothetical protein n=1 Tax=Daejeonella sp. TaxID=2805397 RepID=UPI003783A230
MKKINSNTKCLLMTATLVLMQLLSFAQIKLIDLKDGSINKALTLNYQIKKTTKYIDIENINNRFTNIKQNSPRLHGQILTKPDIVIDMVKLSRICANHISKQQIETLAAGIKYAGLMIDIKTDINGNTLEVSFFTEQNSILTLNQLEKIEKELMTIKLVIMKPEILPLLEGSNFWRITPTIIYEDLLKIKEEMESSKQ